MFEHSPIYSSQIKAISNTTGEELELPGEFRWADPDYEPMDIVYFDEKGSYTKTAVFIPDDPSANKEFTVDVAIEVSAGPFDIEGGIPGRDYEYVPTMGLVVFTDTPLTISTDPDGYGVVDGVSTLTGIVVSGDADLTLNNLHIDPVMDPSQDEYALSALTLLPSVEEEDKGTVSSVTLTLQGDNTISAEYGAALNVWEDVALTIRGEGSLTARSTGEQLGEDPKSAGAGIGSTYENDCPGITIEGGTIHAIGSGNSAGIGAGEGGSAASIKITGGCITAEAGSDSACPIGGGSGGNGVAGVQITGDCFADFNFYANEIYGVPVPADYAVVLSSSTIFSHPGRVVKPVAAAEAGYTAQLDVDAVTGDSVNEPDSWNGGVMYDAAGNEVPGDFWWRDGKPTFTETGSQQASILFVPDDANLPVAYLPVTIEVHEPAFTVTGGEPGRDYVLGPSILTVYSDVALTIEMNENGYGVENGVSTRTRIGVVDCSPTITLRNVRIRNDRDGGSPISVYTRYEDDVTTFVLEGANELIAAYQTGEALGNDGTYPIVIRGTGSLLAESAQGSAAIGGTSGSLAATGDTAALPITGAALLAACGAALTAGARKRI